MTKRKIHLYYGNNDNTKVTTFLDGYEAIEFVETVAESFNINSEEYKLTKDFISASKEELPKTENILLINNHEKREGDHKHIKADGIDGQVRVLSIESVNMFFLKYFGKITRTIQ